MANDQELKHVQRELASARRQLAQLERVAATSQTLADRSKRLMLRSHEELQQLIEELREAKIAAEQATQAKGRFLAMISHELRTPLSGIVGSAELLMRAGLDDDSDAIAGLLHRSGTALLTIVNDVLDYSRSEAGSLAIERIPFSLAQAVQEVVDLQQSVAMAKSLQLHLSLADSLPETVLGDPMRVRQVLLNLLHNALKFTAIGAVTVQVRPGSAADEVLFSVRDTGIGIPPEVLPQLFTAFVQEDISTTRRFGGTGLGLAICKQLVDLMGGEFHVTSEPGLGSTFSFSCRLPAASATDLAVVETEAPILKVPPARVLIVDDHDTNRLVVSKMVEHLGCTAYEACDGMQAVQCITDYEFDLVLMDVSMPLMNGYDATRAVRSLTGAGADVIILALTANALPEDRERCIAAGMNGVLSKPVRLRDLERELRSLPQRSPFVLPRR